MFYRLYVDNNQIIDDTKGIKGQENLCLDIYILCQQEKKRENVYYLVWIVCMESLTLCDNLS